MTLPLSTEIATYLQNSSLGLTMGSNLFVGQLPDTPDECVAVGERPGQAPVMWLTGGVAPTGATGVTGPASPVNESKLDRPTVQVRVRCPTYVTGNTLTQGIFGKLQGVTETTITSGGQLFHLIAALGSPAYIGVDVQQRHEWSQSYSVWFENGLR